MAGGTETIKMGAVQSAIIIDVVRLNQEIKITLVWEVHTECSYITANLYCKSRNLPNTDVCNYSIGLRSFLRHPVVA